MHGQQNVKTPINFNGKNCSKSDACQLKTQWSEDDDGTTNGMKKFSWEPLWFYPAWKSENKRK